MEYGLAPAEVVGELDDHENTDKFTSPSKMGLLLQDWQKTHRGKAQPLQQGRSYPKRRKGTRRGGTSEHGSSPDIGLHQNLPRSRSGDVHIFVDWDGLVGQNSSRTKVDVVTVAGALQNGRDCGAKVVAGTLAAKSFSDRSKKGWWSYEAWEALDFRIHVGVRTKSAPKGGVGGVGATYVHHVLSAAIERRLKKDDGRIQTLVLATGDVGGIGMPASAWARGGAITMAKRALEQSWCVEIWTWDGPSSVESVFSELIRGTHRRRVQLQALRPICSKQFSA
jgi:hypothetical protein